MFLAIWWIFHRVIWSFLPLPSSPGARDRVLADRAWATLRAHFRRVGTIRKCDPYASPMAIDVDRPKVATLGIARTGWILRKHSLPHHLMNALLRKCDPTVLEQAKRAELELNKPPKVFEGEIDEDSMRAEKTPADGSTPRLPSGAKLP